MMRIELRVQQSFSPLDKDSRRTAGPPGASLSHVPGCLLSIDIVINESCSIARMSRSNDEAGFQVTKVGETSINQSSEKQRTQSCTDSSIQQVAYTA